LDIPSKEMLEEAIKAFEGAVIAVSHDRYFLKQIATRVLLVCASDEPKTAHKKDMHCFHPTHCP